MNKSRFVGVRFNPDLYGKLEKMASINGTTVSGVLRRLVNEQSVNADSRNTKTLTGERVAAVGN